MTDYQASILIVDDQPDNIRTLSAMLKGEGHRVRQALNGATALEAVQARPPDLILLDIMMPQMNGYDVCAALKSSETTAEIPVIFLSALSNIADKSKAFALGAVDYITKPFQAEEVLLRVRHQLTIRQQRQQLIEQNDRLQKEVKERQQAEAALRESEEKYRLLFSNELDAISLFDVDTGQFLDVNEAFETLYGYSYTEALSLTIVDIGVEATQIQDTIQQAISARKAPIHLQWHCKKDGTVFPVELYTSRFTWKGQQVICAIARDITDRYQAEVALKQQTEREKLVESITRNIRQSLNLDEILNTAVAEVRQFLQTERVIIYHFNPSWSGTIVAESASSDHLSILGTFINDPCFKNYWSDPYQQGRVSTIEDIETSHVPPCYKTLLLGLNIRANLIVPILHGDTLWGLLGVHHCASPHTWQSWEVDLLRQLTTQLAIAIQQAELHQQVQQLNTTLENQVQERTMQLQRSLDFEALLKRITDKVRDSLDESQILQTVVQELAIGLEVDACDAGWYDLTQESFTVSYEYLRAEVIPLEGLTSKLHDRPVHNQILSGMVVQYCSVRPVSYPPHIGQRQATMLGCPLMDEQGIFGSLWLFKPQYECFSDLEIRLVQQVANQCAIAVRQARLYQAAQTQVEELERLNRLKDDFLSTVSHELRTPISSVKMAAQMLELVLKPLGILDSPSCPANHYLQILQSECQQEISLINDLLDLSRLDAGTEPLALTTVELELWISHVLEPFEEEIRKQQQHLKVNIPAHLPSLETDLYYLEATLTELLSNACKYTPQGETIVVSARGTESALYLTISNSGVEIPAAELPHIFEKFYRVPSPDPWKHGGTGLGLALVQKRVKEIQGSIAVTSEGGWTTFTLTLPWSVNTESDFKELR